MGQNPEVELERTAEEIIKDLLRIAESDDDNAFIFVDACSEAAERLKNLVESKERLTSALSQATLDVGSLTERAEKAERARDAAFKALDAIVPHYKEVTNKYITELLKPAYDRATNGKEIILGARIKPTHAQRIRFSLAYMWEVVIKIRPVSETEVIVNEVFARPLTKAKAEKKPENGKEWTPGEVMEDEA